MNKSTKYLKLFFIFFMTFFILFTYPNITTNTVKAVDITYDTSFEDGTLSKEYADPNPHESWIEIKNGTAIGLLDMTYCYVADTYHDPLYTPKTGSRHHKSFKNAPSSSYGFVIYYYYNSGDEITKWSTYMSSDPAYSGCDVEIKFYNTSDETLLIFLEIDNARMNYYNYEGTAVEVFPQSMIGERGKWLYNETFTLEYLSVENISVTWGTNITYITPRNIVSDPRINHTTFRCDAQTNNWYTYIDDLEITVGDVEDVTPVSDYNKFCEGGQTGQTTSFPNVRYVENQLDFKLNATIHAVDLFIGDRQYALVSNTVSDYGLIINGVNVGSPNTILEADYGNYALRWTGLNTGIPNDYPIFSFSSTQYVTFGQNYYWYQIGVDTTGGGLKRHNSWAMHNNSVYDGTAHSYGLDMCIYYTQVSDFPTYGYADTIHVQGSPPYYVWQPVFFGYTLSVDNPLSYAQLYRDGVKYTEQGFNANGGLGLLLEGEVGTFSLATFTDSWGDWEVRLMRSGVEIADDTFTVVNLSDPTQYNAQITTYPNPTDEGEVYTVRWLYNKTYYSGYTGAIAYTTSDYFAGDYKIINQNVHGDGQMTHSQSIQGVYYYWLCTFHGGNISPIIRAYPHFVGVYYPNVIYVDKGEGGHYEMKKDEYDEIPFAMVNWYGSHNLLGGDVWVLFNDGLWLKWYVGDEFTFDYNTPIWEDGHYTVDLVYYSGNASQTVLDSTWFTVGKYVSPYTETTFPPITDPVILAILTIFVVVGFTFLPLLIKGALKISGNIPPLAYAFSGGLGISICVMLGWVGLWLPFFLIAMGIIITVLFWVRGKGGGGE